MWYIPYFGDSKHLQMPYLDIFLGFEQKTKIEVDLFSYSHNLYGDIICQLVATVAL